MTPAASASSYAVASSLKWMGLCGGDYLNSMGSGEMLGVEASQAAGIAELIVITPLVVALLVEDRDANPFTL